MKKLLLVFAVAAAVAVPAASAGGWATVGLSSLPPAGLKANQDWPVDITVLQHGRTPLAGVTPVVRIRDDGGKVVKSFTATPTGKTGVYHAVVRFPAEGTYSYEVYDGFTQYGGAQTHTFKPVAIGAPRLPPVPAARSRSGARRSSRGGDDARLRRRHRPEPARTEGGRMKKLLVLVATVVAGLALAGVAQGRLHGDGRAQLDAEARAPAGKPWVVTIRVLQHGVRPMPDAKPEVRIRNAAGKLFAFKAKKTDGWARTARASSFRRRAATRSASTTASPSRSARGCTPSSRC